MKIKDTFSAYLMHVKKYRAEGTFDYYDKNFKVIVPILEELGYEFTYQIDDLFFDNIIDYFLSKTTKKNSKINDSVSCIITALNFSTIRFPKRYKLRNDTESFKALSDEELDKLLLYVQSLDIKKSNNLSWSLAICLFLDTGVRLSEILDIQFRHIDYDHNAIHLSHTKNGDRRYVFFNSLSKELLLKAKRKKTDYVLWNYERGTQLNKRSLEHFFDKLNDNIRPQERIHAHRLRKTFATRLLRKGCPLTTISKLLGHKDIRQTMIYLEIDQVMLEKDYNEFYPY
jgi:integrase